MDAPTAPPSPTYRVIRSRRRRSTVAIRVGPAGEVIVRAPSTMRSDELDRFVTQRAGWIDRQTRRARDAAAVAAARFDDGARFALLGHRCRLRTDAGASDTPRIVDDELLVRRTPGEPHAALRERLARWFCAEAGRQLPGFVDAWATSTGLHPSAVLIRDQRRRWGSMNAKGELRLNWRLVQAPPELIDYVVVHELVHLEHANHGPAFHGAVERYLPEQRARRVALRGLEAELFW